MRYEAAARRSREKSVCPIMAFCFWTNFRSSIAELWKYCDNRSKTSA